MSAIHFEPVVVIGLMSGTSADGIDAALIRTDGTQKFEFIDSLTTPYEDDLRTQLIDMAQNDVPMAEILRLERTLTEQHVQACQTLLGQHGDLTPQLVGFHGHTIRHDAERRLTWQIGDPSILADAIRCPVVSDFRRRDIAAGGQGAPLAPLFHQFLLSEQQRPTAVLNLGGVANVTWLGDDGKILAGDVGPGCGLLDAWIFERTGQPYDHSGRIAARGQVHDEVVRQTLDQPFFKQALPKSADRYQFLRVGVDQLSVEDGAATLCAITAGAVGQALSQMPSRPGTLWVTGGGARNPILMEMLGRHFDKVASIEQLGWRADSLEAECFGWLAVRRLRGLPTTVPATTGCQRPTCGGTLTF